MHAIFLHNLWLGISEILTGRQPDQRSTGCTQKRAPSVQVGWNCSGVNTKPSCQHATGHTLGLEFPQSAQKLIEEWDLETEPYSAIFETLLVVQCCKSRLVLLYLFLKCLLEEDTALPVRAKPKSISETFSSFCSSVWPLVQAPSGSGSGCSLASCTFWNVCILSVFASDPKKRVQKAKYM